MWAYNLITLMHEGPFCFEKQCKTVSVSTVYLIPLSVVYHCLLPIRQVMFCVVTFKDTCNGLISWRQLPPAHTNRGEQGSPGRGRLGRGRWQYFKKQIEEIAAVHVDNLGEERWMCLDFLCWMLTIFITFPCILKIFRSKILDISLLERHEKNIYQRV